MSDGFRSLDRSLPSPPGELVKEWEKELTAASSELSQRWEEWAYVESGRPRLRAVGDRVLLRRVHERGRLIAHVHEVMGVTDRVLQLGEVVGVGPRWSEAPLSDYGLSVGDLVVYPTPRIHDHFRHHFAPASEGGPGGGECDVLVLPGYWVSAIIKDWFLAEHPELREYGDSYK